MFYRETLNANAVFDWQRNLFASIFCTVGDMCTQNERLVVDFFKSIIAIKRDMTFHHRKRSTVVQSSP